MRRAGPDRTGQPIAGVDKLDEVMLAATAGELGPITTGIVFRAVLLECMDLFDFAARLNRRTHSAMVRRPARPVPFAGNA